MKQLLSLITIALCSLLLLSCSGESRSTIQELYEAARDGNSNARRQLYDCTGEAAGEYQELYADDICYSDPDEAEKWWKRAKQNGVRGGGPNFYLLFWLRKNWFIVLCIIIGLIIYKATNSKKEPPILLIDTNVWMDDGLQHWFKRLERYISENDGIIQLESIVLGELKGLSKNEEKRKIAQLGMSRIEHLQMKLGSQFLMVDNSTRSDSIADTVLLRTAAELRNSILITNDRELRILARDKGINALKSSQFRF